MVAARMATGSQSDPMLDMKPAAGRMASLGMGGKTFSRKISAESAR